MVHFIINELIISIHCYEGKSTIYPDLLNFPQFVFSLHPSPRSHITSHGPVSLGSCLLRWFLRLSFFWWAWWFAGELIRYFVECPSGVCVWYFSHDEIGILVWGEEEHRGQASFSLYTINITYPCWRWPWPPGWGHPCKVSPLSSAASSFFHTLFFGRRSWTCPRNASLRMPAAIGFSVPSHCFVLLPQARVGLPPNPTCTSGHRNHIPVTLTCPGPQITPRSCHNQATRVSRTYRPKVGRTPPLETKKRLLKF